MSGLFQLNPERRIILLLMFRVIPRWLSSFLWIPAVPFILAAGGDPVKKSIAFRFTLVPQPVIARLVPGNPEERAVSPRTETRLTNKNDEGRERRKD